MNKLSRAISMASELPRLGRIRRPGHSWSEIFSHAQSFGGGFLNPLQRRPEICGLLAEIENMQPRFLMEIGTAQGGNFFLLARACAADAKIISLDLPGGAGGGGYASWKVQLYRRLLLRGQSAEFVREDSHDISTLNKVKSFLDGNLLDVLFIDGDHSYCGAKQDFEMYSPLVRKGGLVAFHDIVPPKDRPEIEVSQLWREIKDRYPHREFIEDPNQSAMGIGVLTV